MVQYAFLINRSILLLDAQFLGDSLWQCILVNHDVHSFVANECLGSIPQTFVFACFTP